MIEKKYKMKFTDATLQDSVAYTMVSKFNIEPSILRAEVEGSGGILILKMKGEESDINTAIDFFAEEGIVTSELSDHISRDEKKCFSCGSCVSICPTRSFYYDPDTYEVNLKTQTCIACGSCITACPTKAIKLTL